MNPQGQQDQQKPPERTGWGINGAPLLSREEWESQPIYRGASSFSKAFEGSGVKALSGKSASEWAEKVTGKPTEGGLPGASHDTWQLIAHLADFASSPEGLSHMVLAALTGGASVPFQAAYFASVAGAQVPQAWKAWKVNPTPDNLQSLLTTMGFAFTGGMGSTEKGMPEPVAKTGEFKGVEGAPRAGIETAKGEMGKGEKAIALTAKTSNADINKAADHFADMVGGKEKNRTINTKLRVTPAKGGTVGHMEGSAEPENRPLAVPRLKEAFKISAPYLAQTLGELSASEEEGVNFTKENFTSDSFNQILKKTIGKMDTEIGKQQATDTFDPKGKLQLAYNAVETLQLLMENPENIKAIHEGVDRTPGGMAKAGVEALGPALVAGHFVGPFGIVGGLLWDIYRGKPIAEAFKRSPAQHLGAATEKLRTVQRTGYSAGLENPTPTGGEGGGSTPPTGGEGGEGGGGTPGGIPPVPPAEPQGPKPPTARQAVNKLAPGINEQFGVQPGEKPAGKIAPEDMRKPLYTPVPKPVGAGLEGKEAIPVTEGKPVEQPKIEAKPDPFLDRIAGLKKQGFSEEEARQQLSKIKAPGGWAKKEKSSFPLGEDHTPVESSSIYSYIADPATGRIEMHYKSGDMMYRHEGVHPDAMAAFEKAVSDSEAGVIDEKTGKPVSIGEKIQELKLGPGAPNTEWSSDGGKTWNKNVYQKHGAGPDDTPPSDKFDSKKFNDDGFVMMPDSIIKAFDAVKEFFTSKGEKVKGAEDLQARSKAMGDLSKHDIRTYQHSLRTGDLGAELGRWMGLDEITAKQIGEDLKLHDIGKLKVSAATLQATGRLSPDQINEIFKHPEEGVKLLKQYGITTKQLADIVGGHHEKYSGGGYPTNKPSKDMALAVRIGTVVDCFDAMTSDRGYNTPRSVEDALKELNEHKGVQFDPDVTRVFVAGMRGKSLVTKETGRIAPQLLDKPTEGGMTISPFKEVVKNRWLEKEATRAADRAKVKAVAEKSRSELLAGKPKAGKAKPKTNEELANDFLKKLPPQ
jgi:hypothetical protein